MMKMKDSYSSRRITLCRIKAKPRTSNNMLLMVLFQSMSQIKETILKMKGSFYSSTLVLLRRRTLKGLKEAIVISSND